MEIVDLACSHRYMRYDYDIGELEKLFKMPFKKD